MRHVIFIFLIMPVTPLFSMQLNLTYEQQKRRNEKLVSAIFNDKMNSLRRQLHSGADINCRTMSCQDTPLMIAILLHRINIAFTLLDWRPSPNVHLANAMGETALSYAILYHDDAQLTETLLRRGARLEQKNIFNSWLLDRVANNKKEALLNLYAYVQRPASPAPSAPTPVYGLVVASEIQSVNYTESVIGCNQREISVGQGPLIRLLPVTIRYEPAQNSPTL